MKLKHIYLLLFLSFFNYSFSCDCKSLEPETMVVDGLKSYDIVFYGEVIKYNAIEETYTFRIIELFKGKSNIKFINGKYSGGNCSLTPKRKELWIVYANFEKNKIIDISLCSPSIGLESFKGSYPPPPPPLQSKNSNTNEEIKSLRDEIFEFEYNQNILQNWVNQIERLRAYKSFNDAIVQKEKTENNQNIIIISLIVNIVLFLALIFILFRKKILAK